MSRDRAENSAYGARAGSEAAPVRTHGAVRLAVRRMAGLGRRAGILSHRPLRWTVDDWDGGYADGRLDAYAELAERARYSVLAGYILDAGEAPDVLDIGCGAGVLRSRLSDEDVGHYIGIDISAEAVARANSMGMSRSRFEVADITVAPVPAADVVVLNEVLYVIRDPELLLDRVAAALRPGGRLLSSIWRHPGDRQIWSMLDRRFERIDEVRLRNPTNKTAGRGWRLACHTVRSV